MNPNTCPISLGLFQFCTNEDYEPSKYSDRRGIELAEVKPNIILYHPSKNNPKVNHEQLPLVKPEKTSPKGYTLCQQKQLVFKCVLRAMKGYYSKTILADNSFYKQTKGKYRKQLAHFYISEHIKARFPNFQDNPKMIHNLTNYLKMIIAPLQFSKSRETRQFKD